MVCNVGYGIGEVWIILVCNDGYGSCEVWVILVCNVGFGVSVRFCLIELVLVTVVMTYRNIGMSCWLRY